MPTKLNAEGVVKPLEWRGSIAKTAFGEYTAERDFDDDVTQYPWCAWAPDENIGHFATLPEAKAAAQADYEHRILSCLTPDALAALDNSQPTPAGGDDGLIERLNEILNEDAPEKWVWKTHASQDEWIRTKLLPALRSCRTSLAAAHAQHEADAAMIKDLADTLRRIIGCHDTNHEHQREKLADIIPLARSALAKVKP